MVQRFKESGHLVFKSVSALSRGILKTRRGRCTIHFNGDPTNTELLFQTVHSVNQLSVYGAVANWCHQFAWTEEEKGQVGIIVDNFMLTIVEAEEMELLVSLRHKRLEIGCREAQCASKPWKRKYSLHNFVKKPRVTAAETCKIRPDGDDGWRETNPLCREYSSSRSYPKTQAMLAILEGTIIWASFRSSRCKNF